MSGPRCYRIGMIGRTGWLVLLIGLVAACDRDGGMREIASPAGEDSTVPHLARTPAGDAVMSWIEPWQEGHRLRVAALRSGSWLEPVTVASGDHWFVNWADFPSIVPIDETRWLAHWLVRAAERPYAYDVYLADSQDGGQHWAAPFKLHHDGTLTEHGFVSMFPRTVDRGLSGSALEAGVVWLDGRETAAGGAMTLRAATVTGDGLVADERLLDERVCDCCQTDAAWTDSGPIVAYRDRTVAEIRDISIVRRLADGWTEPVPAAADGWHIEGCPVNGPAIAARGLEVALVWYTAANDTPRVRLSRSIDGGETFTEPVEVSAGAPLGRVDVDFSEAGHVLVSWLERDDAGGAELRLRRFGPDPQDVRPAHTVVRTALNRPAGFPQMLRMNDHVLVAWTDVNEKPNRIRTILVPLTLLD